MTIIDTAGGVSAATTAAIRHADLCLIPARPSIADIEAAAPTLSTVRAWKKPFAFVLNQTVIRGQRIANAATALGDKAARELGEALAQPFITMRNDHQDALSAGLAVSELAPGSKSADEIRGAVAMGRDPAESARGGQQTASQRTAGIAHGAQRDVSEGISGQGRAGFLERVVARISASHFRGFGHQRVERPFCVRCRTIPP